MVQSKGLGAAGKAPPLAMHRVASAAAAQQQKPLWQPAAPGAGPVDFMERLALAEKANETKTALWGAPVMAPAAAPAAAPPRKPHRRVSDEDVMSSLKALEEEIKQKQARQRVGASSGAGIGADRKALRVRNFESKEETGADEESR